MPAFGSRTRIIALVGENENHALYNASEGLGGFFMLQGYQHQIINMMGLDGGTQLTTALKTGDIAFVYGFAGVGSQLSDSKSVNLWTAYQVPFLSFWHDHPAYNYRQHIVPSPYILNCYHVQDHLQVRERYLPSVNSATLLHSAAGPNPPARAHPWKKRSRKFLYVKTAYQPEQIAAKWEEYPLLLRNVLWDLVEQAQKDRNLDLAAAAEILFHKNDHPITDLDAFMGVIQEVDHYIRAWRSDRLARALLAWPSDIFGRGWDYLSGQPSKATIHPAFPSWQLAPTALRYRLVANSNPLWRDGIHERVIVGIATGCVTLTDHTIKSDKIFGDLPNYVGLEWTDDIQQSLETAWEKAYDDADYLEASEQRVIQQEYTQENFMRPLEKAITNLLNRASTSFQIINS
ncbi:MAG: hypothetical protein WAO98_05785 [Alphaproteobacteria bacterium]